MCWTSKNNIVIIPEEDIEVFKVVRVVGRKIKPYVYYDSEITYGKKMPFWYWVNKKTFKNEKQFVIDDCYDNEFVCSDAFHSYSKNILWKSSEEQSKKNDFFYIVDIRDNLVSIYRYPKGDILIMHCVIPKGTRYAVNENGEIVSDAIKIVSFEKVV